MDRHTDIHVERHTDMHRQTDTHTCTDRYRRGQTHRHTDVDRHTDVIKQTCTCIHQHEESALSLVQQQLEDSSNHSIVVGVVWNLY